MTKNQKTGGLSIDLTIDNEAITNPGTYFKPIAELPKNITQAGDNVANAAKNLKLTFDEKVKSKSMKGFTTDYKGKIRGQELNLQAKIDPKVVEALKTLSKNPEFAEAELEKVLNKAAKISGVDGSVDIEFYRADDGTMGAHKNGKIFINLAYQTGTTETLMNVLGNELSHYVDYKQGKAYDATRQSVSTYYGDDAERQAIASLGGNTVTLEQALSFQADVSKLDFSQTNAEVAGLEKKTFYIHGTNSNPQSVTPEFIASLKKTYGEDVVLVEWSGGNSTQARKDGAKQLYDAILQSQKPGESLNLVGHSHGGNVIKEFTQIYGGDKKVDSIVFLGTPHRSDHVLNWSAVDPKGQVLNVYDPIDLVTPYGGKFFLGDVYKHLDKADNRSIRPLITVKTKPENISRGEGRGNFNLPEITYKMRPDSITAHSAYYSREVWDKEIDPQVKRRQ